MKILLSAMLLAVALSASNPPPSTVHTGSARQMAPRANEGHLPPAPTATGSKPADAGERLGGGHVNSSPHVNHNQWFGHDQADDTRYRLDRPFSHGRFEHFGPDFRYRFLRVDPYRHWFWFPSGFYFEIAAWDWPAFADWCWDCGDDFVVYEDPDHIGWYLLYNVHTGTYVHVQSMGR
jgi:hypothetical protein